MELPIYIFVCHEALIWSRITNILFICCSLANNKLRDEFFNNGVNHTLDFNGEPMSIILAGILPLSKNKRLFDYSVTFLEVIFLPKNSSPQILIQINCNLQTQLTCVVTNADFRPHWYGMIHIFQPLVWFSSLILCAFVCMVIWLMARNSRKESPTYTEMHRIILNTIRLMVGNIPSSAPRTPHIRCVVILWSVFCLTFYSAYTTSLVSMITTPIHMRVS